MNCKKCGQPLSEDAKFCTNCGADMAIDEIDTTEEKVTLDSSGSVPEEEKEAVVFSTADIPDEKIDSDNSPDSVAVEQICNEEASDHGTAEPDKKDSEKKKTPKKPSAGKVFAAVMISVLAVIFLTAFNLSLCIRIGLSSDIVRNTAESMSMETILSFEAEDGVTVSEYICDHLSSGFISRSGAKPKDVGGFLVRSDFLGFTAETLESYAEFLINGSLHKMPELTSDDIVKFLKDNKSISDDELGYYMDEADYADIAMSLEENGFIDAVSLVEWGHETGFYMGNVSFVFSVITIGIFFALALVLCIWIAILLDKNGRRITAFFGSIALICGLILFIPSVVFVLGAASAAIITNSAALYICSKMLLPLALTALCTGIFEIVVGVIFKRIKRRLKKKELRENGGN